MNDLVESFSCFNVSSFDFCFLVTPNDSVVRRSISQQKVAVSITIDDPVRTGRQLSPPRGKTSNIIHVCNLVSVARVCVGGPGRGCGDLFSCLITKMCTIHACAFREKMIHFQNIYVHRVGRKYAE